MRTQDEVVERIYEVRDSDFFGFKTEVLTLALDFEHARPWLNPDTSAREWVALGPDDLRESAASYLDFAWRKAAGHRGISASRSIDKLAEYAWLLGRADIIEAMDAAPYPQYGVPKLVAFAQGMRLPVRTGDGLDRMALGEPCDPSGCGEGCV